MDYIDLSLCHSALHMAIDDSEAHTALSSLRMLEFVH